MNHEEEDTMSNESGYGMYDIEGEPFKHQNTYIQRWR